jgi:hypothetical protein
VWAGMWGIGNSIQCISYTQVVFENYTESIINILDFRMEFESFYSFFKKNKIANVCE